MPPSVSTLTDATAAVCRPARPLPALLGSLVAAGGATPELAGRLLAAFGADHGWTHGALWALADDGDDTPCLVHEWRASTARAADGALLHTPPGACDALRGTLSGAGAAARLVALDTPRPGPRQQALRRAGFDRALLLPLHAAGRVVAVLEWLGQAGRARADEMLEHAALVSACLGPLWDHERLTQELLQFRQVIDALPDQVFLTDREQMRFTYVNQAACSLADFSFEQYTRLGPQDSLPIPREQLERTYDELIADPGRTMTIASVGLGAGGRKGFMEVHRRAIRIGGRWKILSISRDQTERTLAERAQQRLSRLYNALVATNEAMLRAGSRDTLLDAICNAAVEGNNFAAGAVVLPGEVPGTAVIAAAAGLRADELRRSTISTDPATPEGRGLVGEAFRLGRPAVSHDFLNDPRTRPWHESACAAGIACAAALPITRCGEVLGVLVLYSTDRRGFPDEVMALLQRLSDNIAFSLNNLELEAERARNHERISYLATHDALTGLPNRLMFGEHLAAAIRNAQRHGRRFAVLFVDLDRFKIINDSLGHAAGDALLQEVSRRLKHCLRASDIVARLGGDEFVVLLHEVETESHISSVARKILDATVAPLTLAGQDCRISASVGISLFPNDAQDAATLMRHADTAMYAAKAEGKNNFQYFSRETRSQSAERLAMETRLRNALDRDELALHYQPKINLQTGAVTGVEALLRWTSPEQGPVSPAEFIPLAEDTGLIVPIGLWVLRTACAQNASWLAAGLPPLVMAVNLSARQFVRDDLPGEVVQALHDSGLPPHLLELEITEGMVVQNPERALRVLERIKATGVRLAIDDFGTGYSSLGQLRRFPIDTLKIDRSFIRDLAASADDRAIAQAIVAMSKSLRLNVVAEGVETAEQREFLRAQSCDEMQGFHFSRPLPAAEAEALLRRHAGGAPGDQGSPRSR